MYENSSDALLPHYLEEGAVSVEGKVLHCQRSASAAEQQTETHAWMVHNEHLLYPLVFGGPAVKEINRLVQVLGSRWIQN